MRVLQPGPDESTKQSLQAGEVGLVAQAVVPVLHGDTEVSLAARVLAREHMLYPLALRWCLEGALRVENGVVTHRTGAVQFLA